MEKFTNPLFPVLFELVRFLFYICQNPLFGEKSIVKKTLNANNYVNQQILKKYIFDRKKVKM